MSFQRLLRAIEVPHLQADQDDNANMWLDNDDLRPLPAKDKTWGFWTYLTFWFSAASSIADWYACSAGVAAGLSPLESLFCSFGGRVVISIFMAMNGRGGAVYGIPFPSLIRSSFGVFGGFWPVISRVVLSIIYQGLNLVSAGLCVYVLLHSLTPSIANLPNIMPEGAGIDTGNFIGIIIVWVIFIPVASYPIPKMKWTVYVRLVTFIIAAIAMLVWCSALGGGAGRIISQPATAQGAEHKWLIVRFFFIGISSFATFTTNAADFHRYATRPNHPIIGTTIGGPLSNFIVHTVGVVIAASSTLIFGEMVWNPILLLDRLQTENYTPANRAGCFFLALLFCYGMIITMIFENILPAANDLSGILPRFINYKRGALLVAVIALAINPWYLLGSAAIFTRYLSSFGIFLGSIIGVMLTHYYVINRGYLNVDALFWSFEDSPYFYWRGFNVRAYVAYFVGIIPTMPGFAGAVGRSVPLAVQHSYYFAFPTCLILSSATYLALCLWKPVAYQKGFGENGWHEPRELLRSPDLEESGVTEAIEVNSVTTSNRDGGASDAKENSAGTKALG